MAVAHEFRRRWRATGERGSERGREHATGKWRERESARHGRETQGRELEMLRELHGIKKRSDK